MAKRGTLVPLTMTVGGKDLSGWMDGRMSEKPQYICVFIPDQECPVRKEYKLQPENLLGYCKVCYINPINEPQIDMKMLSEQLPRFIDMYLKMKKGEKEHLLDIIKIMSQTNIVTHFPLFYTNSFIFTATVIAQQVPILSRANATA